MVEYREHLKATVSPAAGFASVTIPTGITSLVQNFGGRGAYGYVDAMIIHEIIIQKPTAYAQTDNCKWHVSTKSETAVKKTSDSGVILAADEKAGTAVGAPAQLRESYKLIPPEVVSATNLYFAVDTSDTGQFDIDIIYTIRKVDQRSFLNALLPNN